MKKLIMLMSLLFINTSYSSDLILTKSILNFDDTVTKLTQVIESKGLKIFSQIDHAEGAASVKLDLRPTTLIIFGSAKIGTMIMQKNQSAGLELPLKILVSLNERKEVVVIYNNPAKILKDYKIKDLDKLFSKITKALNGISSTVIKK